MTSPPDPLHPPVALRRPAAMARLGRLGLDASDLDEFLDGAVELLAEALGLPAVAILELVEERGVLVGRAGFHRGRSVGAELAALLRLPTGRGSFPGYTLLAAKAVKADDLVNDPRFLALAPTLGFDARAAISVPIRWANRDWGVVSVYDDAVREWSDDEVSFMESAANVIALTVQRHQIAVEMATTDARLDQSLVLGGLGAWDFDGSNDFVHMDATSHRLHGVRLGEFEGTPDAYMDLVEPDDRPMILAAVSDVMAGATAWDATVRVTRRDDGQTRWINSTGRVLRVHGHPLRVVGVCADVTDQVLDEIRVDASLMAEMAARRRAEQAGARMATLSEASALFSQSLEPDVILATVAEFCVPLLADICRVETFDESGHLVARAARAVTAGTLAAFEEVERRCPGLTAAVVTGAPATGSGFESAATAPVVVEDIDARDLARAAADSDQLVALKELGPRTVVIAPLVSRDTVLGRVTLIETDHVRRQRSDHVSMIGEVAARAAMALDNGRLYQSRARMVDSLQSVLVPRDLPESDGLHFAARYRVGDPRHDVGGDFYDAFEIDDDEWGVMVGDVCGRGADAAALTGLVRHSIRAAVVRDSRPTQVLSQTNDAVIGQIDDFLFCTATYMNVRRTQGGARVVVSSAGHPRPVVVRADGTTQMLDSSGVILGVTERPALVEAETDLAPGDAVVLYTDGVTEARNDEGLFGDERLIEVLAGVAGRPADEIAAALDDAVKAHHPEGQDDLAIVVVQATSDVPATDA